MNLAKEAEFAFGGLGRVVAIGPRDAPAIVVMLHGYQMEPRDLSPFARSLGVPAWFLFPEAPHPVPPHGYTWWPSDAKRREESLARGPRDFAEQHPPDLAAARATLSSFLDAVFDEADARPVIACGFSQGGMLTCDTLLRARRNVAALALLSASRIAFDEWRPFLEAGHLRDVPVFISHGMADRNVAFDAGVALKDCLSNAGAAVTWVPFEQGHEIPLVVWRNLRKFLQRFS